MSHEDIDRVEFLLGRKFPGYTAEVCKVLMKARPGPRGFELDILPASESWNLKGASIPCPPATSDLEADKLAHSARLKTWINEARAYEKYLYDLADDEFMSLYEHELALDASKKYEKDRRTDIELFFNEPTARADFSHWNAMALWKAEEAVALSLGKDPAVVTVKALARIEADDSPFVRDFHQRFALLTRAIKAGKLASMFEPSKFLIWAAETDVACPPEMGLKRQAVTAEVIEALRAENAALSQKLAETQDELEQANKRKKLLESEINGENEKSITSYSKLILGLTERYLTRTGKHNISTIVRSLPPEYRLSDKPVAGIIERSKIQLDVTVRTKK